MEDTKMQFVYARYGVPYRLACGHSRMPDPSHYVVIGLLLPSLHRDSDDGAPLQNEQLALLSALQATPQANSKWHGRSERDC